MSGACGHLPVRGGMLKLHCPAPVLVGGPRSDMAPISATVPHSVRGYTQTKARPNTPWYLATEVPVGSRQPGMAPVSVTGQHSTRRHQQTNASFASLRHSAAATAWGWVHRGRDPSPPPLRFSAARGHPQAIRVSPPPIVPSYTTGLCLASAGMRPIDRQSSLSSVVRAMVL